MESMIFSLSTTTINHIMKGVNKQTEELRHTNYIQAHGLQKKSYIDRSKEGSSTQ